MRDRIEEIVREQGITNFGFVAIEDFVFEKAFHEACATNRCGKYGTSWSCPPGAGTYEELLKRVRRYSTGLVVQTVWSLEDSFDIEGMLESAKKHNAIFRTLSGVLCPLIDGGSMVLSAGSCTLCETCSYVLQRPCRMPDKAMGTLEAHGVDVTALVTRCGMKYNNGPDTVSYVGVILFND